MARTGFVHHPLCLEHLTGPGHPERPGRLAAILARFRQGGLAAELAEHLPEEAPERWLLRVHTPAYLEHVRAVCRRGPGLLDASDTVVCEVSEAAARRAAGGLLAAVDRVMEGTWDNAFVAVRPPGHHAVAREAMGFCLYNTIAVGARYLREQHGLARVAIVDFDVHHGNGTQEVFEADPTVFFASLHQYPHYPGTGSAAERGRGAGEGATLNCPLAAGTGDREWLAALEREVLPALESFRPQFLLVSAGFDAHLRDPLSATRLSEHGYELLTRRLLELARSCCGGRLVSLLEGGYDLEALAASAERHVEVLLRA